MEALEQAFGQALYEIALKNDRLDLYNSLLDDLLEAQKAQPDLIKYLAHPKIEPEAKADLLIEILPDDADEEFKGFLRVLCRYRQADHLEGIARVYKALVDEERNIETVLIQTARPLDEEQEKRLVSALEKKLNCTLRVQTEVVPDLIGGLRIETDGYSLDASFKKRLETLKEQLLK